MGGKYAERGGRHERLRIGGRRGAQRGGEAKRRAAEAAAAAAPGLGPGFEACGSACRRGAERKGSEHCEGSLGIEIVEPSILLHVTRSSRGQA